MGLIPPFVSVAMTLTGNARVCSEWDMDCKQLTA